MDLYPDALQHFSKQVRGQTAHWSGPPEKLNSWKDKADVTLEESDSCLFAQIKIKQVTNNTDNVNVLLSFTTTALVSSETKKGSLIARYDIKIHTQRL